MRTGKKKQQDKIYSKPISFGSSNLSPFQCQHPLQKYLELSSYIASDDDESVSTKEESDTELVLKTLNDSTIQDSLDDRSSKSLLCMANMERSVLTSSDEGPLNSSSEDLLEGLNRAFKANPHRNIDIFNNSNLGRHPKNSNRFKDRVRASRSLEGITEKCTKNFGTEKNSIRITGLKINLSNSLPSQMCNSNVSPIFDGRYDSFGEIRPQSNKQNQVVCNEQTCLMEKLDDTAILQRVEDLEQTVKEMPVLEVKLTSLDEDNSLLEVQLTSGNAQSKIRKIGVGNDTLYVNPRSELLAEKEESNLSTKCNPRNNEDQRSSIHNQITKTQLQRPLQGHHEATRHFSSSSTQTNRGVDAWTSMHNQQQDIVIERKNDTLCDQDPSRSNELHFNESEQAKSPGNDPDNRNFQKEYHSKSTQTEKEECFCWRTESGDGERVQKVDESTDTDDLEEFLRNFESSRDKQSNECLDGLKAVVPKCCDISIPINLRPEILFVDDDSQYLKNITHLDTMLRDSPQKSACYDYFTPYFTSSSDLLEKDKELKESRKSVHQSNITWSKYSKSSVAREIVEDKLLGSENFEIALHRSSESLNLIKSNLEQFSSSATVCEKLKREQRLKAFDHGHEMEAENIDCTDAEDEGDFQPDIAFGPEIISFPIENWCSLVEGDNDLPMPSFNERSSLNIYSSESCFARAQVEEDKTIFIQTIETSGCVRMASIPEEDFESEKELQTEENSSKSKRLNMKPNHFASNCKRLGISWKTESQNNFIEINSLNNCQRGHDDNVNSCLSFSGSTKKSLTEVVIDETSQLSTSKMSHVGDGVTENELPIVANKPFETNKGTVPYSEKTVEDKGSTVEGTAPETIASQDKIHDCKKQKAVVRPYVHSTRLNVTSTDSDKPKLGKKSTARISIDKKRSGHCCLTNRQSENPKCDNRKTNSQDKNCLSLQKPKCRSRAKYGPSSLKRLSEPIEKKTNEETGFQKGSCGADDVTLRSNVSNRASDYLHKASLKTETQSNNSQEKPIKQLNGSKFRSLSSNSLNKLSSSIKYTDSLKQLRNWSTNHCKAQQKNLKCTSKKPVSECYQQPPSPPMVGNNVKEKLRVDAKVPNLQITGLHRCTVLEAKVSACSHLVKLKPSSQEFDDKSGKTSVSVVLSSTAPGSSDEDIETVSLCEHCYEKLNSCVLEKVKGKISHSTMSSSGSSELKEYEMFFHSDSSEENKECEMLFMSDSSEEGRESEELFHKVDVGSGGFNFTNNQANVDVEMEQFLKKAPSSSLSDPVLLTQIKKFQFDQEQSFSDSDAEELRKLENKIMDKKRGQPLESDSGLSPDESTLERTRPKSPFSWKKRISDMELGENKHTKPPSNRETQDFLKFGDSTTNDDDVNLIQSLRTTDLDGICEIINNHLMNLGNEDQEQLKSAVRVLQEQWFELATTKTTNIKDIQNRLRYFKNYSEDLLKCVINFVDLTDENNILHYAFFNDRFDIAEEVLKTGLATPLLSKPNILGVSPIIICALSNPQTGDDWFIVQKVFELGNVNSRDLKSGQTPLMNAVSRGSVAMTKLLLACGADLSIQDVDGSTALMFAAEQGRVACAKILLEHPECKPDMTDYEGSTACSIALEAGHSDLGVLIYFRSSGDRGRLNVDFSPKQREKRSKERTTSSKTIPTRCSFTRKLLSQKPSQPASQTNSRDKLNQKRKHFI